MLLRNRSVNFSARKTPLHPTLCTNYVVFCYLFTSKHLFAPFTFRLKRPYFRVIRTIKTFF